MAAIYRHGGGNPFYLEQLGRASGDGAGRGARRRSGGRGRPARRGQGRDRRRAGVALGAFARVPRRRGRRGRAVRAGSRRGDRGAVAGRGPGRARRPAGAGPDPPHRGAAPLHLPPPARAQSGLRVDARRLAARRARQGGRRARARGARARRARPPHRAVRRPRATRRRSSCCSRPAAPRRRARPATAARWFEAALRLLPTPTRSARSRCASRLPRRCARSASSTGAATSLLEATDLLDPGAGRAQGRADRPLRGGRALAGTPRRRPPPADPRVGGAGRPRHARRPPRCRSSWASTACTGSTSSRRSRWAGQRSKPRARVGDARPDRRGRRGRWRWPRRPAGRTSSSARAHLAEALEQIERLSDTELARRLETLYYLGWAENYLELYDDADRARRARRRDRARHRRGPAADPADAACAATRSRCRAAWRRRSRCARPPSRARGCRPTRTTSPGRCSSSAGAHYFSGNLDDRDRGLRGERARRRRPPEGRDDAVRRRRPGLGARGRVAGDRRDRARASS